MSSHQHDENCSHDHDDDFGPNEERCVVFFGDSITDCGRDRQAISPNVGLGSGYAMLAAAQILSDDPGGNWQFWNRGIGGNRIYDLEARLQSDVLDLKPDMVSILIGINDTWRRYDSGTTSSIEDFTESYRRILSALNDNGIGVMMLEPFLLPVPEDRRAWRADLNPRIEASRDLAREFSVPYLPLDGAFAAASTQAPPDFWLPDGVHPSLAGHGLIATAWLEMARQLL